MILVDTSIWIDHLRAGDGDLVHMLDSGQVLIHPFVIGELACGTLINRKEVLALLKELPRVDVATEEEVLYYIERHSLMGRGVGSVDAHLLAAASLFGFPQLWTRDKRLRDVAAYLGLAH